MGAGAHPGRENFFGINYRGKL